MAYRRDALVRIGGFSEWSLVEDLHTSIRLHAAGARAEHLQHGVCEPDADRQFAGRRRAAEQRAGGVGGFGDGDGGLDQGIFRGLVGELWVTLFQCAAALPNERGVEADADH